jgi:hypothetical protein
MAGPHETFVRPRIPLPVRACCFFTFVLPYFRTLVLLHFLLLTCIKVTSYFLLLVAFWHRSFLNWLPLAKEGEKETSNLKVGSVALWSHGLNSLAKLLAGKTVLLSVTMLRIPSVSDCLLWQGPEQPTACTRIDVYFHRDIETYRLWDLSTNSRLSFALADMGSIGSEQTPRQILSQSASAECAGESATSFLPLLL